VRSNWGSGAVREWVNSLFFFTMGRAPCCERLGLKKGPWTPDEDQKLVSYIRQHGHGSWRALPEKVGMLKFNPLHCGSKSQHPNSETE
jgi:hypothetical protein